MRVFNCKHNDYIPFFHVHFSKNQLDKSVSKPGKEQQNKCDLISPCQVHCYRAGEVKSPTIITLKNGVIIRSDSFELTNP